MIQTPKHHIPEGSSLVHTLTQRVIAKKCLLTGSALLLASMSGFSTAAEKLEAPNWYQIEFLVFTQPKTNIQAEYWQESLQPKFEYSAIQLRPNDGFEFEHLSDTSLESEQANRLTSNEPTTPETDLNNLASDLIPHPLPPRQLPTPLLQEYSDGAFTLLSQEQLEQQALLDTAAGTEIVAPINTRLLERRGHRILFQGLWRQPVYPREVARSIVIRGGEALAPDYFELEGDIQLSLSRYLHLRPNLYFTLALPPEWQSRHPRAIEALAKAKIEAEEATASNVLNKQSDLTSAPTLPLGSETEAAEGTGSAAIISAADGAHQTAQPAAHPQYLTLHLDQSRRMRRNELHYIDHPLFGVLIRITAYTPEAILPPQTAFPLGNNTPASGAPESSTSKASPSTTGPT